MRRFRRFLNILGMLVAVWLVACGPKVDVTGLETLPDFDLSAVEPVAREQLGEQRRELEQLFNRAKSEQEMAEGFGDLGEIYQAYQMPEAAAICYRNARALDENSFLWPYLQGVVEQQNGDFEVAAEAYRRALELRPGNGPAQIRLAEIYLARGEKAKVAPLLEPLVEDEALAAAAAFGLGRAADDPAVAVEFFERALALDPEATAIHHPLGLALRRLGRTEDAEAHLAAQGANPVTFEDPPVDRIADLAIGAGAWLRRGNQALMREDYAVASDAYRRAVEAQPSNVDAQRNLALALSRAGQLDDAIQELKRAIEKQPESVWLHYDLGNLQMEKGRPEAAIASLETAVELSPDLEPALFNLGSALVGASKWEQGREVLRHLVDLAPENTQARYLLAVARGESGERESALDTLRQLAEAEPEQLAYRRSLAKLLLDDRRPQEALAVYRQALTATDLDPQTRGGLLAALAELEWRQGRRGKALEAFRQAVELRPESSVAHTQLANALQLAGQREEAARLFARAVELDPENATAWLSEGTLWILLGEFQRARQRLEAAVEIHPENVGLVHTLARLLATSPDGSSRDGRRALILANQALSLENNPQHAETVGMAMAEMGQFEKAIQWQRSLMAQAAQMGDQNLLRQMAVHLRYYEQRRPIRAGTAG